MLLRRLIIPTLPGQNKVESGGRLRNGVGHDFLQYRYSAFGELSTLNVAGTTCACWIGPQMNIISVIVTIDLACLRLSNSDLTFPICLWSPTALQPWPPPQRFVGRNPPTRRPKPMGGVPKRILLRQGYGGYPHSSTPSRARLSPLRGGG